MKYLKKALYIFIITICFSMVIPVIFPKMTNSSSVYAASKVKLNTTKKTLIKGTTYTLKVKNTSKKVKWYSSNKKIATVSSKGKVKAIKKGTTYIKAKVGSKTYSCKIKVEQPSISKSSYTMTKGTAYTLKVNGNTQSVKWYSSDKKIATVDSKGRVNAIKKGTTYIKAKVNSKTYSCKMKVESPYFSKTSVQIKVTNILQNPLKGTSKTITYKSDNSNIAKVDKYGTIYAVKAGNTTIRANISGKTYNCNVTVLLDESITDCWKTICGIKYYYIKGEPVTGLQTIDNRKYMFNNNGILTSKFGIDVSEHQGKIDWDKAKSDGVQFAIIRCGYGMDEYPDKQDDSRYAYNIAECTRLKIPYGIYLYSYADSVKRANSEADHVLRLVKGRNPTLGIWYDIEDPSTEDISNQLRTDIINTFCKKIKAKNFKVGIYANLYWLNTKIEESIKNTYPIWAAQYNSVCEYKGKYQMWQYTSKGSVNGIKGNVDFNILF